MTDHTTGVGSLDTAEFTPEEHALAERAAAGWLPADFAHAEIGGPASAERHTIAAALGLDGAESLTLILSPSERQGLDEVARVTGLELDEIARRALAEYLDRHLAGGQAA